MRARSAKPASPGKKPVLLTATGLIALLAGLLVAGVCFQAGTPPADLTGTGQAEILTAEYLRESAKGPDLWRYEIRVTTDRTKVITRRQPRQNGWDPGVILPVVYDRRDPENFILDTTPEAYTRWTRIWNIIGLVLTAAGTGCLITALRRRRASNRSAETESA